MSTGSVSDPEEMELRGLQRGYPISASKRPPLRGAERSYISPSDNSSAEEEDPDGEEERCALDAPGGAGGCKRKRPRVAGGGGKKPLPPKGSAAECKQSQRNAANARERARMRVLSKAFSRLKTSLPWVPPDTKLSKLDTLRLASSYIAHLRQLLQEDRYENGYVHPVNLVGASRATPGASGREMPGELTCAGQSQPSGKNPKGGF
ncbi:musculin isoform X1 [Manis pentadactyla]|uniref:musculin isoform X1 n=1 Tax=Manis pentadactyla TaxID=143292 RepID=UPI001875B0C5|nr:musculin isoform X1 [Manis pentadactyla]